MFTSWITPWNSRKAVLLTFAFAVVVFAANEVVEAAFSDILSVFVVPLVTAVLIVIGANVVATPGFFILALTLFSILSVPYAAYGSPGASKILLGFGTGLAFEIVWTGMRSIAGGMGEENHSKKLLEKLSSPLAAAIGTSIWILLIYAREALFLREDEDLESFRRILIILVPIMAILGGIGGLVGDLLYRMNRRIFRRMLISAFGISAAVYVGLVALLYAAQASIVFIPSSEICRTPSDVGWEYEEVSLDVGQEKTSAWFIHAQTPSKGVILFSHGNAGNISGRLESAGLFREMGYDVLLYDYGGFGESTGTPSEERCYQDIRAAWRYLTEDREIAPNKIVLHGRSLGAGPTCQLATEVVPAATIIESAFTSVPDVAQKLYPFIPAKLVVTIKFDNSAKIGRFQSPVLVVHSPDDTLIPFDHGKKLFELADEPKTFLEISGDHNEGFWTSREQYTNGVTDFLEPLLGGEQARPAD